MGVEPTGKLLCRQPPYRLAPASLSVLARNRTWTSTFAGLHAHPAHPEDVNLVAARRGVEPRLAVSKTAVRSGTLAGCVNQYPDLDLNQGLDLRRVRCNPLHHRDKQSRRLDLHQHLPVYKTGAFCSRATSAKARARGVEPRGAVLEAAGSPRSTLVWMQTGVSEGSRTLTSWFTARHAATATPQTPCQSAARPGFEPGTPR